VTTVAGSSRQTPAETGGWAQSSALLLGAVVVGVALRLSLFTGMALGDDVLYSLQAIAHAVGGMWPPEPYHWQTRLGVTGPAALSILAFGLKPAVFVLWPLLASVTAIVVCHRIAADRLPAAAAALAALFLAVFPLDVLYATHLFPDIVMGLLLSLSLWYWIKALETDSPTRYALSGLFFGLAYLSRETVFMAGPTYLALWWLAGRAWRPTLAWVCAAPLVIFGAETLIFGLTTESPMYRFQALTLGAEQQVRVNATGDSLSRSGGELWSDPLLMLVSSHEFGLFHIATLLALPIAWRRTALRPFVVWWLVTFLWHSYGTAVPGSYVPLTREPRYLDVLSMPAVIILGALTASLPSRWPHVVATAFVATGILSATLDQRDTILGPHRALIQSGWSSGAVLEPYEYFGARWVTGLDRPASFACAIDLGRRSAINTMHPLPHTALAPSGKASRVVFSPERRPELLPQFAEQGWIQVAEFRGEPTSLRRAIGHLLRLAPGQAGRVERLLNPPGLIVLERP
jgi:hypothetical protein